MSDLQAAIFRARALRFQSQTPDNGPSEVDRLKSRIAELELEISELKRPVIVAVPSPEPLPIGYLLGRPSIADIKQLVCKKYQVRPLDLDSKRRTTLLARARQVAYYLARQVTLNSLPEIGRRIGNRDHTTVIHGVRKITAQREIDPDLDAELRGFEAALKG